MKSFGQASIAVSAFGVAAAGATAKWLGGLGDQQIQMEMLSRQLWTTQQQAQAFILTLKAMGTNLQELYLSPTLMSQYRALNSVALQMQTPADYTQQIRQVQSIQFQLKQLRLEAYYGLQWVGYYFIKYMSGPITTTNNGLQKLNQMIIKNMPTWTKQVAQWMAAFFDAGIHIADSIGSIYNWLQKLLAYVPGWAKAVAAGLALILVSNPFMLMVESIGLVLLLLDDFYVYLHGGKSALAPFWAWLTKLGDSMKGLGIGTGIAQDLKTAFDDLGQTFKNVAKFADDLFAKFKENGTIKKYFDSWGMYTKAVKNLGDAIGNLAGSIGDLYKQFSDNKSESDMQGFFQMLADLNTTAIQTVSATIQELSGLVNIVADILKGDWSGAASVAKSMVNGDILKSIGMNPNYTSQTTNPTFLWRNDAPPPGFTQSGQSTTNNVTIHQTITGTGDPKSTGDAAAKGINVALWEQMQNPYR